MSQAVNPVLGKVRRGMLGEVFRPQHRFVVCTVYVWLRLCCPPSRRWGDAGFELRWGGGKVKKTFEARHEASSGRRIHPPPFFWTNESTEKRPVRRISVWGTSSFSGEAHASPHLPMAALTLQ